MAKKSKLSASTRSSIRIIGGRFKGRKLPVLDCDGLRPTPDRVRETVFNWLMHDINQALCLDICAGSGGLGFEALSRGAKHVDFIEHEAKVIAQLKQNQAHLGLSSQTMDIVQSKAEQWLAQRPPQAYDIVFVDPPYQANILLTLLELLIKKSWLTPHAKVYFETNQPLLKESIPSAYRLLKEKKAGQIYYYLTTLKEDRQ